jgi:trehalose-phosphatase
MADLETFFALLESAARRVLLLDYDGTLAPFRVERDQAVPYPGVQEVLQRIRAVTATRLVFISGRPWREVVRLLDLDPTPEVWGSHGWEWYRPGHGLSTAPLPDAVRAALAREWRWLAQQGLAERGERKVASIAVHWRGLALPQARDIQATVRQRWQASSRDDRLQLLEFAAGLELRVPGRDKGTAVREVLAGVKTPVAVAYLGDDLTDEDAFRAVAAHGLGILVGPEPRSTAATHWLRPPVELLAFLDRWAETAVPGGAGGAGAAG